MINYLFCLIRKLFLRSPSQLLDMSKVKSLGRIPLETSGPYWQTVFNLQKSMGIVYLKNRTALALLAPRNISLLVQSETIGEDSIPGFIINITLIIKKASKLSNLG